MSVQTTIMKGSNLGMTCAYTEDTNREWVMDVIRRLCGMRVLESDWIQVDVCDFCGCLHKTTLPGICSSCADAVVKVQIQQASERLKVMAIQCGNSLSTLRAAMLFATEAAGAFGRMETPIATPGSHISDGSEILDVLRQYNGGDTIVIDESSRLEPPSLNYVMAKYGFFGGESEQEKRLAWMKQRGPEKRGAWWNGKRRW